MNFETRNLTITQENLKGIRVITKEYKDLKTYYFTWYDLLPDDLVDELPHDYYYRYNKKRKVIYKIEEDIENENLGKDEIQYSIIDKIKHEYKIRRFFLYKRHKVEYEDEWCYSDQPDIDNKLNGWLMISSSGGEDEWIDCVNDLIRIINPDILHAQRISNIKNSIIDQIINGIVKPKHYISKRKNGYKDYAWAIMIKERDKKCSDCGSSKDLHAHHIKSVKEFPELRYDINNGITLCQSCHIKFHQINGYK